MPLILGTNSIKDTGYDVDNSCRFNGADSAELTKTFGSAGNQKTWTFSCWLKRSTDQIAVADHVDSILEAGYGSTPWFVFTLNQDTLAVAATAGSSVGWKTAALFRDTSAWYHIVLAVDTTSSTSSISNGSTDRFRIFVNNVQQTLSGGSVPSQNADLQWNGTAGQHMFGASYAGQFFDGYVSEVAFIDGSALNPSSFGEYDSDSPTIWKPKDFKDDVTFGTNGYYLDFADSGDLGDDESGNGNDWTEANLAATDQSSDSPTNNFATLNPLFNSAITYSEGNLHYKNTHGSNSEQANATIQQVSNGRWYWEIKMVEVGDTSMVVFPGVMSADHQFRDNDEDELLLGTYGMRSHDGKSVISNGSALAYATWGASFADGDIVNLALDMDNNRLYIGKGGQWSDGSGNIDESSINAYLSLSTTPSAYMPMVIGYSTGADVNYQANFGNPPFSISSSNADANGYGNFEYAVPSGYYALCTKNLAEYG